MYEHHTQPLLPWRQFIYRLISHLRLAGVALVLSLLVGTAGFHWLAGQKWIDAFLNSSMLLGGMGPVGDISSIPGKLFASIYALYAGLFFIGVSGLLLAPIFHRVMHKMHLQQGGRHTGDL